MSLRLSALIENKSIAFSIVSQIVSLGVSVLMTVGVTRYLSVELYGYWQLFVFYVSYIGFMHFGLCDGLYLRYGGVSFDKLSASEVKSFFVIFITLQIIFAALLFVFGTSLYSDIYRQNIIKYLSVLLIIANSQIFFGFILLSANRIIEYSISVFIDKILMLLLIILLIIFNKVTVDHLMTSYIFSKIISVVYLLKFYSPFIKAKLLFDKKIIYLVFQSGFVLMLSNIISTLVIGVGRYFVDVNWDIATFGKVSLSVSLVYFVLLLLSQLSYILFPVLRNNSEERQVYIFNNINRLLGLLLKISVLLYFPLMVGLKYFLPNYIESINYILLLLPLCLFDGKMQILYSSFFKNLYLQKELLYINILCMCICLLFSFVGSIVYHNIEIVLIGISISIIIRSVIAEYILMKKLNDISLRSTVIDIIFSVIIISSYFFSVDFFLFFLLILLLTVSYRVKYAN